jgi:hypothetical protein
MWLYSYNDQCRGVFNSHFKDSFLLISIVLNVLLDNKLHFLFQKVQSPYLWLNPTQISFSPWEYSECSMSLWSRQASVTPNKNSTWTHKSEHFNIKLILKFQVMFCWVWVPYKPRWTIGREGITWCPPWGPPSIMGWVGFLLVLMAPGCSGKSCVKDALQPHLCPWESS